MLYVSVSLEKSKFIQTYVIYVGFIVSTNYHVLMPK